MAGHKSPPNLLRRRWLALFLLVFSASAAWAQTAYTWVGTTGGTWSTTTNWTPNTGYPGQVAGDSATIGNGSTVTLDVTPANPLASLTLTTATDSVSMGANNLSVNAGSLSGLGSLSDTSGVLTASGSIGSVTMTGGSLTLNGNLTITSLAQLVSVSGAFNLLLQGTGADTLTTTNLGTGTLDLTGMTGGSVTASGALTAATLSTASAAYSIALNGGGTVTNAVTFSNTGTLTLGGTCAFNGGVAVGATVPTSLSVSGTVSATGTSTLNFGTVPVTITATPSATSTIGGTSTGQITLGAVTINDGATLTLGTGVATPISVGAITSGGAFSTGSNLTINSTGTITPSTVALTGSLTLTAGTLPMGANSLSVGGNLTRTSGLITSSGTVTLNGAAAQTADFTGSTLTNLTLNNSSGATLTNTAGFTLSGNVVLTAGSLNLPNQNQNIGGSISGAGTFNVASVTSATISLTGNITANAVSLPGGGTFHVSGNWNVPTVTASTGTLDFNGAVAQTIVPNGQSLGAVTMSGTGGVSLSGTATMSSLSVSAGETLTVGGGTTTVLTVNGTYANAGTTSLSSTAAGAPTTLTMGPGTSINNTGGTLQVSSSTGLVTLDTSSGTTTLSGNALTLNGKALTLSGLTTAVAHTLTTTDTLTLTGSNTFNGGLTVNAAGASVAQGTSTLSASTLSVTAGSYTLGAGNLSVSGALTNGGTFTVNGTPTTFSVGSLTSTGTWTNTATNTVTSSGNVSISGTFGTPSNSTITMTGATTTLNTGVQAGSLAVSGTGSVTVATTALNLAGTLSVATGGSLTDATSNLGMSVAGTATINGSITGGSGTDSFGSVGGSGTWNASSGTSSVSGGISVTTLSAGTGTINLTGTQTISTGYTFNNLTVTAGAGTVTLGTSETISGNVTITSGVVAAGTTLNVGGNWTNTPGVTGFTAGSSTVNFTGAVTHSLSGATNFAGLSDTIAGSTLTFSATQTFGVSGLLTLSGASGSLITVQSSVGGTTWSLNNTGTNSVSYVKVSDSPATTASVNASNSIDATGNNTNWVFAAISWKTSGTTDANLASNWSTGVTPGQYDSATVPAGGTQPIQTGALSLKGLTLSAAGSSWSNGGQNLSIGTGGLSNSGTFTYTGVGTLTGMPASFGGTFVYSGGTVGMLAGVTGYTNLTVSGGTITAINASVSGSSLVSGGTLSVPNAITLTLNGASNQVTGGTLQIQSGGIVNAGTNNFSILTTGILDTSGTLDCGAFASSGTGGVTNTASNTINASGAVSISGPFGTPTNSTIQMSKTATINTATQIGNLTLVAGSTPVVTTSVSGLNVGGNLSVPLGTTLTDTTLGITVTGSVTVGGTLNGGSGTDALGGTTVTGTWSASTGTTTVSGNITASGGTVNLNSAATVKVSGNLTLGTVTNPSGSTINFNGVGAQTIVPNGQSLGAVTMSGTGGVSLSGTATMSSLSVSAGETLTVGGGTTTVLTVNGLYANAGTTSLSSTAVGAPTTLTMGPGTSINNTGGTLQVSSSTGLVTLDTSSGTTTLSGNALILNGKALTLSGLTATVAQTLTTTDTLTLTGSNTFNAGLTVNAAGASVAQGTSTLSASTLSVTAGSYTLGAGSLSVSGALTNGGTFTVNGTPTTFSVGSLTSTGTWTNTATNTVTSSGNVSISGTFGTPSNSTITMTGATTTLNAAVPLGSLTTNPSSGTISLSTNPLSLTKNLRVLAGNLDMAGLSITMTGAGNLSGTVSNSGAAAGFTANAAITLAGATSITTNNGNIDFVSTIGNSSAQSLTLNAGSSGNVAFGGSVGSGTALGAITITDASNVSGNTTGTAVASSINGASLTQSAGTTLTWLGAVTTTGAVGITGVGVTLNGAVSASGGFSSSGTGAFSSTATGTITTSGTNAISITTTTGAGSISVGGALTTASSGGVTIKSSGSMVGLTAGISTVSGTVAIDSLSGTTVSSAGTITATGTSAVTFGGILAGALTTSGNVVTTGGAVTFTRAVTLGGPVSVDTTNAGGLPAGANIDFVSTVDGAYALNLNSGSTGNTTITGVIGTGSLSSNRLTTLTISNSNTATFSSAVWLSGPATVSAASVVISGSFNAQNSAINLYGQAGTPGQALNVGGTYISASSLANINSASSITIGQSGTQSGLITITGVTLAATISGLTAVNINSDSGAGGIALNDTGGTAFDANANTNIVLTLSSGTSGITASNGGTQASIANTGTGSTTVLKTNSTGLTSLGATTSGNRIVFASGSQPVQIINSTGSGTVALGSLGALTIGGTGNSVTGNRNFDVTTASGSDLTFSQPLNIGTGNLTLSPGGKIVWAYPYIASPNYSVISTGSTWAFNSPVILNANTYLSEGVGASSTSITFSSTATINDGTVNTHSLTIDGGTSTPASVTFGGDIGAGTGGDLAAFTVQNVSTATFANVGSSSLPQVGVSGAFSVSTTGAITWTGSYYSTGAAQTWFAGGSLSTPTAQTMNAPSAAVSWTTPASLNLYGNFTGTGTNVIYTFKSNDIGLNPSGTTYGAWTLGSTTNELDLQTVTATTLMNVGYTDSNSAHWNLDDSELASLNVATFVGKQLVVGLSGTQSGTITIQTANLSAANSGSGLALVANSDAATGSIVLDTASNNADALNTGSGSITLNAYASITALQIPHTPSSTFSDLVTSGAITLSTNTLSGSEIGQGPLATYAASYSGYYPIVINDTAGVVNVSGKNSSGVWLMGNGTAIQLGTTTGNSGSITTDLYGNSGTIYLTQNVNTNGNPLVYNGPVVLSSSVTLTTLGGDVSFNSTLDDASSGSHSLTIAATAGAVTFTGAVGGTTPLGALSVTSASTIHTVNTVTTSTTGGGTGNVSFTHTGVLTMDDATSTADTTNFDYNLAGTFTESGSGGTVNIAADLKSTDSPAGAINVISFADPITLTGNVQISTTGGTNANQTFASTIDGGSGPYAFITDGTGTKTFDGTIGGTTRLASFTSTSAGTLQLNADLKTNGTIISADTTVNLNSSSGALDSGSGSITISNAWNVLQNYTISSSNAGASHSFGAGTVTSGKTLTWATSGTATVNSLASTASTANLTFDNTGTVSITGATGALGNSFANVNLNQPSGGIVNFNGALYAGTLTQSYGSPTNTGAGTTNLNSNVTVGNLTVSSAGTMAVTTSTAPTVTVNGVTTVGENTNTYSGTLDLGKASASLGSSTADVIVLGKGQLNFDQATVTVLHNLQANAAVAGSLINFNQASVTVNNNVDLSNGSSSAGQVAVTLSSSSSVPSSLTVKGSSANFDTAGTVTDLTPSNHTLTLANGSTITLTSFPSARLGNLVIGGATPVVFTNSGTSNNATDSVYSLSIDNGGSLSWSANNFNVTTTATLGGTSSGTITASATAGFKVGTNLTLNKTSTLSVANGDFAVLGNLALNGSGTVTLSTASSATNFGATPLFEVAGNLTWSSTATSVLDLSASTATFSGAQIAGTNVTASAGATGKLKAGLGILKVGSASNTGATGGALTWLGGSILENTGTLDFWGNVTVTAPGAFTKNTSGLWAWGDPAATSATTSTLAVPTGTDLGAVKVWDKATVTATDQTFTTDAVTNRGALTLNGCTITANSGQDWTLAGAAVLTLDSSAANSSVLSLATAPSYSNLTIGTGCQFNLTNASVHVGAGKTVAVQGTLALSTSATNLHNTTNGFFLGAGTLVSNTGTINLTATQGGNPIRFEGPGTSLAADALWSGSDLSWTGGDLALASMNFQAAGTLTVPAAGVLYLDDGYNRVNNLTILGFLSFNPFAGTTAQNLEVDGNWDDSSSAAPILGLSATNGSTVTFNNTVAVTLKTGTGTAGLGTGKNLYNLTLAGTGKVTLSGGDLGLWGSLTQNATASLDVTNRNVLVEGNLSLTPTATSQTTTTGSTLFAVPTGARTVTLTSGLALNDFVLNASGGSLTQASDVTVHRLVAFKGNWNTNGFNLTTTEDFVAYGSAYQSYTLGGNTYYPMDDGELASRGASYYQRKLGYPYFGGTSETVAAMHSALGAAFGLTLDDGTRTTDPAPGLQTATFTMSAGKTLAVGRNFYNFGASMTASGVWTLLLPDKWTLVTLNAQKTTDWFGEPFAVAIATASGMTVQNSKSVDSAGNPVMVAAAQTSVAGTYTPGTTTASPVWLSAVGLTTCTNWDNTQPDIDSVSTNQTTTRFDNLVEVHFSKPMLDSSGEANSAVGSTTAEDDVRFGVTSAVTAAQTASVNTASDYAVTEPQVSANSSVLGFIASGTATWNTDATGTLAGGANAGEGGASSTDRSGVHQTLVPDVTIEKGRLYDTSGNPIVNRDGVNDNGATGAGLSTVYEQTADGARPVLIKVLIGQQNHASSPSSYTPDDSHNYFKLVFSEPVTVPGVAMPASNTAATTALGDAWGSSNVTVTGLFSYAGTLDRSTRTYGEAHPGVDPTTDTTNYPNLVNDSLFRTTSQDLIVSIAGYSTGTGAATYWDGFIWNTTVPTGHYTVQPLTSMAAIKDASGNLLEDGQVTYVSPLSASADPKTGFTIAADTTANEQAGLTQNGGTALSVYSSRLDSGLNPITAWEVDPPVFAPFSVDGNNYYELLPTDLLNDGLVHQFQIHILANTVNQPDGGYNTPAGWNSTTPAQPDTTLLQFGLRDSSLKDIASGFSFESAVEKTFSSSYNLPPTGSSPFSGNTTVQNTLFTPGSLPGTQNPPDITQDDGYFNLAINVNTEPGSWRVTSSFTVNYNMFSGMLTNLSGVLLGSLSNFHSIDRTPPTIVLTLAARGATREYVQFSRLVTLTSSLANYSDVLSVVGDPSLTIKDIVPANSGDSLSAPLQEIFVDFNQPLTADQIMNDRIKATSSTSITANINQIDASISYPISDLALDVVDPVWASDGSGGQLNQTGTAHVVHDFLTGTEYLTSRDIDLQAQVWGTTTTSLPVRLYFDHLDTSRDTNHIWLPTGLFSLTPAFGTSYTVVPQSGNSNARYLDPYASQTNTLGVLKNFKLPGSDPDIAAGRTMEFLFRIGSLYAVHALAPDTDPRQMSLWSFPFKAITTQKNGVTVLNNVIDPTKGQETEILYTMKRSGIATIQVFDLDGNLIKVLHRGRQSSGDYTLFWDGTNTGGRPVARGIYFIRVVAPDTDETRNVLIIK